MTDANLVLGRLDPDYFLGGEMMLKTSLAVQAVTRLAERLRQSPEQTATAIVDIADENMTNAIRLATIERGIDPRRFALIAFGGAGPLHAVAIARKLGTPRVVVPPHPGLVSALGAAISELRVEKVRTVAMLSDQATDAALVRQFAEMEADARAELAAEGLRGEALTIWILSMRYFQQNYEQDIAFTRDGGLPACLLQFHQRHEAFYGYSFPDQPVEIVHLRLSVYEVDAKTDGQLMLRVGTIPGSGGPRLRPGRDGDGSAVQFAVYRRASLTPGAAIAGPAIIEEADSTTFLPSGARLEVLDSGNLLINEAA